MRAAGSLPFMNTTTARYQTEGKLSTASAHAKHQVQSGQEVLAKRGTSVQVDEQAVSLI